MSLSVRTCLVLATLFLLSAGQTAFAATGVSLRFDDHTGTPNDGTYFVNMPFVVSVMVDSADDTANNRVQGVGYFLKADTAGAIKVNSRTVSADYSDATPNDATLGSFTLNPGETPPLGSSFPTTTGFRSNGSYKVADFNFQGLTSGDYTISFDTSTAPKLSQTVYQPPTPTPGDLAYSSLGTYTVHILAPEPTCLSGIVLLMGAFKRPRRRAA